jgi:3'-phosphoadenosine 5'-phosphosulfate synthase
LQRSSSHDGGNSSNQDLVNERMPMCVGICVLVAIVFVLSRTGADPTSQALLKNRSNSNNNDVSLPTVIKTTPSLTNATTSSMALDDLGLTSATSTMSSIGGTTATSTPVIKSKEGGECAGLVDPNNLDMGAIRAAAFANTPPHIIECAAENTNCHLPSKDRFASLGQKGATIWMTGCSGAGKTTIATALEDILVKSYGKHVYRLDGDNLRTGLNRDLTFTEADRAESVRRTGELATLFADAGVITLVGLISPYRADRDMVRQRHLDQGIPFYEVFLDVPIEELKKRDPKGQYAKVRFFFLDILEVYFLSYDYHIYFSSKPKLFLFSDNSPRWRQEN